MTRIIPLSLALALSLLVAPAGAQAPPEDAPPQPKPTSKPTSEPAPALAAEGEPTPEEMAQAKERYQRATELYRTGDYKLALIEFERCYQLAPSYRILYNIGQLHMTLREYAKALRAFERYLDEGGDAIDEERREQIAEDLERLRGRTAMLTVESSVEGAEVRVDGVPVGVTPLPATMVDAGEREVEIVLDGRRESQFVVLAGRETRTLTLELPEVAPPPAPPPAAPLPPPIVAPEPPPPPPSGLGLAPILTWVGTGIVTAAAVGTGIAALGTKGSLAEAKDTLTAKDELDQLSARATNLSLATDVLIGSAVVLAGVSIVLTVTDEGLQAGGDEDEATGALILRGGLGGLSVSGRF